MFFQIDFVKNPTWLITFQSQRVWRRNPRLIFVASRSTYQSIILVYPPSYLLEITIIQPKQQKKDNTTRPILHPFSSDSLLPIFESFTAHHVFRPIRLHLPQHEGRIWREMGLSNQCHKQRTNHLRPKRILIRMGKVNLNLNLLVIEILNALSV